MILWQDYEIPFIILIFVLISIIVLVLYFLIPRVNEYFKQRKNKKNQGVRSPFSGLKNTKETCYMNAMIQALASSDKLIKAYEDLVVEDDNKPLIILVDLLKNINQSKDDQRSLYTNSEKLMDLVTKVQWNKESQQDAFQMLSFFINDIQRNMGPRYAEKKTPLPPKFQLHHAFSEDCKYNKVQDHLALAVPLVGNYRNKPGVFLESLIEAFFTPSTIDDGPNTTSMVFFGKEPDILILHIQANEWSHELGVYVKPEYHIMYKETLSHEFMIQEEIDGSKMVSRIVEYRLMAVVQHMGGVDGGHYVTYRRHQGQWFLTNDEQVEWIDFKYDVTPYIMVYEKI